MAPQKKITNGNYRGYHLSKFDSLHLLHINEDGLRIDIYYFFTEITLGIHNTFEDLKHNHTQEQLDRLRKQINILGLEPGTISYAKMHQALSAFDETKPTLDLLKAKFTELYL